MQNPITFLPTEPSSNAVKQVKNSSNSGADTANSFKQVLSREISEKQNSVQEQPEKRAGDKVDDKNAPAPAPAPQDVKQNVSSQPTRIEPVAEDESKIDIPPSESAQTNGVQLIALVESLAQFSPKITEKAAHLTSAEVASIETNATNLPLSKTDLIAEKLNPKTDPNVLSQNNFEVTSKQFSETTLIADGGNTIDPSSSTKKSIAATPKGNDVKSEKLPESMIGAGIELSAELKASLPAILKTDVQTDPIVNFTIDVKPDLKPNLYVDKKPDPKAAITIDVKADPKINLNTALNVNFNTDPKIGLNTDPKIGLNTDPKIGLNTDPKIGLNIDPKIGLNIDPKIGLNTDPKIGLNTDPKIALNTDSKVDLKTNLLGDLNTDPKVDFKTDLTSNLKTDLTTGVKTELRVDPKVDSKIDSKIDSKVDLKIGPSINLNVDPKVNLKTDLIVQESGNFREQSVKIAEISPSAQNYAQQVSVTNAQINVAAEVEHLAPRVGTPAWNQSIGQKVVWMVAGGQQTAELTLNPPDLGPMQVVLSVNNDQANATFISAHPDVRDALESAMPKLRQMLNDAGVQLSGFSVKSESSNPGAQFAGDRSPSRSKNNGPQSVVGNTAIAGTSAPMRNSTGNGIVDTFA